MEAFRHVGMVALVRERLNSLVRVPAFSLHRLFRSPGVDRLAELLVLWVSRDVLYHFSN